MNTVIEEIVPWIELLENVIYDDSQSPNAFEEKFCDGNELLSVYFSSESILVQFLMSSGETVSNTYNLRELSKWLDNNFEMEDGDE